MKAFSNFIQKDTWSKLHKWTPATENAQSDKSTLPNNVECLPNKVKIPRDGTDEWELDQRLLEFGKKVASGSFGDLYVLQITNTKERCM